MSSDLLKRKRKLSTEKNLSKNEPSEEEVDDDEEEYEVEAILDKRVDKRKGGLFYLIKWKNWSDKYNSWEPFSNLDNCLDLLEKFEFEYSKKKNNNNDKDKSNKLKKKTQAEEVQEKEKSNSRKRNYSDLAGYDKYDEEKMFKLAIEKSIEEARQINESESDNNVERASGKILKKGFPDLFKKQKPLNLKNFPSDSENVVSEIPLNKDKKGGSNANAKNLSDKQEKDAKINTGGNNKENKDPKPNKALQKEEKSLKDNSSDVKKSFSNHQKFTRREEAEEALDIKNTKRFPQSQKMNNQNNNFINLNEDEEEKEEDTVSDLRLNEESDSKQPEKKLKENISSKNRKNNAKSTEAAEKENKNTELKEVLQKIDKAIDNKKKGGEYEMDEEDLDDETPVAIRVKSLKLNNDDKMLFSVIFRKKAQNGEEEFIRNIPHEQMIEEFPDVLIDFYESKMKIQ